MQEKPSWAGAAGSQTDGGRNTPNKSSQNQEVIAMDVLGRSKAEKVNMERYMAFRNCKNQLLLKSVYDTFPTPTNLKTWGLTEEPNCKLCGKPANLCKRGGLVVQGVDHCSTSPDPMTVKLAVQCSAWVFASD